MPDLVLRRVAIPKTATFGVLVNVDSGAPFAVTVERDSDGWSNRPSKGDVPGACIPNGTYTCKRVQSPRFGNTFEVTGVPNRSHILFHGGNLASDSRGCIIVGHGFDPVNGVDGIVSSKKEFAEFLALQSAVMEFKLHIINP